MDVATALPVRKGCNEWIQNFNSTHEVPDESTHIRGHSGCGGDNECCAPAYYGPGYYGPRYYGGW